MARKMKGRSRAGWALAEVLCSMMIISMVAAFIVDLSGKMYLASVRGMEARTSALDFSSIAGEAERMNASDRLSRGSWQANVETQVYDRGIGRMEISVLLNSDATSDAIRWTTWEINGRAR